MNVKLSDQGRSLLNQLQIATQEKSSILKRSELQQKSSALPADIFEKSAATPLKTAADAAEKSEGTDSGSISAGGLNISFQFDLFYELSAKVEAKMGQSGANRFAELSGKVSETFMGSFNLQIDAVGSFMNGTDKSLDISPETTSEFFDAVEGLADLSPEALENFLKESDEFFSELESTYGEADGAFDQIKGLMQDQAKAFFSDVEAARQNAVAGGSSEEATDSAAAAQLPEDASTDEKTPAAIKLVFQPETSASQSEYKDFLKDFLDYTSKFRQQMFDKLLGSKISGYGNLLKAADEGTDKKSAVDTAA
jgi:hypothetical protein